MPEETGPKKPRTHWFHIPAQLVIFGFWLYWQFHLPAPNKAVLILTGVTIVMALLDMRPIHKASYLLLVIGLMFTENRAINKDRTDTINAENERRWEERESFNAMLEQERKHFQAIMAQTQSSMAQAQIQFSKTMARSDRIVAGVGDAIKAQTGGDSFAFITLTGPEPPILTFNGFSHPSGPWMLVAITSHGKYPLRDVRAVMMDDEQQMAAVQEANKNPGVDWSKAMDKAMKAGETRYQYPYLRPQSPEAPSGEVEAVGAYEMPQGARKNLRIHFGSFNGYWNEVLHLGLVNGTWRQCLSVMGPTVKQAKQPFIWCDSDWPEGKELAEKDWVFPKLQSQKGK